MPDLQMSARVRQPLTGRSNGSISKKSKFSGSISMTPSMVELNKKVNDTLNVRRPFTPEEKVFDTHIQRPPVLPQSRYNTLQYVTNQEPQKRRYPLRCPEEFIVRNAEGPKKLINEYIDNDEEIKEKKTKASREFIIKNKHQIWKMDRRFFNKTPQEICHIMVNDESNFDKRMEAYKNIERIINTSSSNLIAGCLKDDHLNSLGEVTTDPYLMTAMGSSRVSRIEKMNTLLKPGLVHPDDSFRRGFRHTADYGNFSQFVGYMNLNAGGLDR